MHMATPILRKIRHMYKSPICGAFLFWIKYNLIQ